MYRMLIIQYDALIFQISCLLYIIIRLFVFGNNHADLNEGLSLVSVGFLMTILSFVCRVMVANFSKVEAVRLSA